MGDEEKSKNKNARRKPPSSPIDPHGPPKPGVDATAKAFQRRRFDQHVATCERAWRAGVLEAVREALSACLIYQEPPPQWLLEAVAGLIRQQHTPAYLKRRHELAVHYARFDAVRELSERADELRDEFLWEQQLKRSDPQQRHKLLRALERRPKSEREVLLSRDHLSWDAKFEAVSLLFKGTPAAGSVDTIAASYKRVQADMKRGGAAAARYFLSAYDPRRKKRPKLG
jgi:hypothetical protein